MENVFELADMASAQNFMRGFARAARAQGEALARDAQVSLSVLEPGRQYVATIDKGGHYIVELEFDPLDGWAAECTCNESLCAHAYTAMAGLIVEHRAAAVRSLSSGTASAAAALANARARVQEPDQDLARRLAQAKGSALNKNERSFVARVHRLYLSTRQLGGLNYWDWEQLGLAAPNYQWERTRIWETPPANDFEFWLYLAHDLTRRQQIIPHFMLPVTDLSLIQEKIRQMNRSREIQRWTKVLQDLRQETAAVIDVDLRLMIEDKAARLQWRPGGQPDFQSIKSNQARQLASDLLRETRRLPPEAQLLWQMLAERYGYQPKLSLDYDEVYAREILGRILRNAALESRVVTAQGSALPRPAEKLRWEVIPAQNAEDDYQFRLRGPDGGELPEILCEIQGNPTLYLTGEALFTGPAAPQEFVRAKQAISIPAPALEQEAGVAFLHSLEAQLPPRLEQKILRLPVHVILICELKKGYREELQIIAVAEAEDGMRQEWTGAEWEVVKAGRKQPNRIVLHEDAALRGVPGLLAPLGLSRDYGGDLTARMTKKFPEIFSNWLKSLPPDIEVRLNGELASLASAEVSGQVRLEATEAGIDWFDLRVALTVNDTTLTQAEIKLLLNAKGGYVRLEGKGWRRLEFQVSEEEDERLARLGLSTKELSAEPQRLHALQLADDSAKKFLPAQQAEAIQRRAYEIKTRVTPPLPEGVQANLRPYQLEGFHFLAYLSANNFGGILADDMGLGKTLQTLAWLLWLRQELQARPAASAPAPSLVVCPKSVMDNWHAEALRFTPGLRVRVWSAAELSGLTPALSSADLHVINYSQLRNLADTLVPVRWLAVILDEGQYIKNPNSQTAQVARALHAEHRLILSGTPIENRLLDLWSLMSFAMPGVLGNRTQFLKLYDPKDDPFARRRLAARVRPFVLRRTKTQVAKDLPDRVEEDLFCEIEGEQKTLYSAELKRAQQLLLGIRTQQELAAHQFHFLTSLLRLRQICCHPALVDADSKAVSAKTEALLEQLEPLMEEGQKVLVFSQFVQMLDLLKPTIEERQWPVFYLSGATESRGELVKEFQSKEGPAVFLISLKAGGFGLNLTAASYVVLFDPWWNPAVENQAIDRTHRIGQTRKVIAYRLLIKNSIEEKIRELQKQKRALAEDVLGEEKFSQSLTLSDLQFLFSE
jgi:SNF2-related domain/Helicase conserved C-terminal domain